MELWIIIIFVNYISHNPKAGRISLFFNYCVIGFDEFFFIFNILTQIINFLDYLPNSHNWIMDNRNLIIISCTKQAKIDYHIIDYPCNHNT